MQLSSKLYRTMFLAMCLLIVQANAVAADVPAATVKVSNKSLKLGAGKKLSLQKALDALGTLPATKIAKALTSSGLSTRGVQNWAGTWESYCADAGQPSRFGHVSNDVTVTFAPSSETEGTWTSTGRNLFSAGNACSDADPSTFSGLYYLVGTRMITVLPIDQGGGKSAHDIELRGTELFIDADGTSFFFLQPQS